jgi:glutamate-5-semialdehyde dehydrogenase
VSALRLTPGRAIVVTLKLIAVELVLYAFWSMAGCAASFVRVWFENFPQPGDGIVFIVTTLLATAYVVWSELHRGGVTWRTLGAWRVRPSVLVLPLLLLTVGSIILVSEADNLLQAVLPVPSWFAEAFGELTDPERNPISGPLSLLLVAPITEEILFRGVILNGLLRACRPGAAITISAALFAFGHLNPWQLAVAFGFGLVLGWIYYRTSSLPLCMLGHVINNTGVMFVSALPFEIRGFNSSEFNAGVVFQPWWFDLCGIALVAAGAVWFHRRAPAAPPLIIPPPLPKRALAPEPPLLATKTPPPVLAVDGKSLGGGAALSDGVGQMSSELAQLVTSLAQRARAASLVLATAPRAKKDAALEKLADLIDGSHFELLEANQRDLLSPEAGALPAAARERLTLNEAKLRHLAASVREVVALPDPVGELLEEITRPNGLRIRKVRVPIGVIGIIFEARPNVTVDCAILCLKSGNASILRGGKECFHTNMALAALIQRALTGAELPADAVQLVPTTDRAALTTLLKLDTLIHCVIPRGGESLIRFVAENSTIPVIKHYKGVCFVYVDDDADLAMAESITVNAKAQRPSVCNAAEQLLVHRSIAEKFLPQVARSLVAKNVQLRCDSASAEILARESIPTTPATPADYTAEFLDYVIAVRVVDSLDTAITTINRDSSNHSDAIVTADETAARRFLAEVDSATVYWNASTRFTDGYEFGYGAEIGISTDRLHARGPMGLRELCSYKFLIEGTGQVRG